MMTRRLEEPGGRALLKIKDLNLRASSSPQVTRVWLSKSMGSVVF